MTTTKSKAISRAASQIGGYYPGDSPYGVWYGDRHGSVYDRAAFCAMGLSWVFWKEGALDIFPEHAYTPSGANWFKSRGRWHSGSINSIKRGDILFFNFPGYPDRISHVGIAEKDGSGGRVQTIEFNTSSYAGGNQRNGRTVARKVRTGYIVGWGRPAYGSQPAWKGAMGIKKLRKGDKGNDVGEWQEFLKSAGYDLGKWGVDKSFGDVTDKATRQFQKDEGLEVDGVVGKNTQKAAKAHELTKPDQSKPSNNKPSGKKPNCKPLQRAIRTTADNKWGKNTDKHGKALREASNWGGNDFPYGVAFTQKVVGTKVDNKWGENSRAAHDRTVGDVQNALKEMGYNPGKTDYIWGEKTESAYQAARSDCRI